MRIFVSTTGKQVDKPHKNFLQWWYTSKYGFAIVLDKELGLANVTDAYNDTESGFIYNVMSSKEEGYVSRACLNLVKKGSYYTLFGSTGKVLTDSIVNIETDFNAKHGIVGALNKVYDYEGNLIKTVAKNHTCSAIDPIAISCGEKAVPVNKIVYSTSSNEPESKTYCVAMVLQQPGTMFGYFTEFESDSEYKLTDLIDIARSEKYKYNNLGSMKEIYILSDYGSCQDMKTKFIRNTASMILW